MQAESRDERPTKRKSGETFFNFIHMNNTRLRNARQHHRRGAARGARGARAAAVTVALAPASAAAAMRRWRASDGKPPRR
jgi:hypothetical protein